MLSVTASTALAAAPTAATTPATKLAATSATLNGDIVPSQNDTTFFFQYGTTTDYGTQTPTQGPVQGNPTKSKSVSADVTGLQPQTTYQYRLVATNSAGTSFGANVAFTTPAAGGAPGKGNTLSIAAAPATIIYGNRAVISGRLSGPNNAGVTVTLQRNFFPFTGGFTDAGSATTDNKGDYSFTVRPTRNVRYRVSAKTSPPVTSTEFAVSVRVKVTLGVSDRTPARRQSVRFSGLVTPAHNGKVAKIQRRTATGTWTTVATATLKPAAVGTSIPRSRYSRRLTIRRTGTYRVRVSPADGDHAVGRSPSRRLVVH